MLLTLTCWSEAILLQGSPQIPSKMNPDLNDRAEARLIPEDSH